MDTPINPFENGAWAIENEKPIKMGNDFVPAKAQPYMGEASWRQYSDMEVYQVDKLMREWLREMTKSSRWCRTRNLRRYKFSEIFKLLLGRDYDRKADVHLARKLSKLFAYYCSSVRKSHYDKASNRWQNKTDYCISSKALNRPAYSLRLRLEEMQANGIMPTAANMRLPSSITKGHSIYPNTERIMREREARGKEAFNAYQRERRRIRAEQRDAEELANDGSVSNITMPGQNDGGNSCPEGQSS